MKRFLLCLLLVACSGESQTEEECHSFPWTIEEGLEWCEGRFTKQTVFVACEEPPAETCAPAERSGRDDAWCCWGL